eukprot:RCo010027
MAAVEPVKGAAGSRPRVLCLHGFGTNARFMRLQTKFINPEFNAWFELVFMDAPHPYRLPPNQDVVLMGVEGPYFQWWDLHGDSSSGLAEAIDAVCAALRANAPVHGLMGFSQGALLAMSVCLLQHRLDPRLAGLPALQFAICWAGFLPPKGGLFEPIFGPMSTEGESRERARLGIPVVHICGRQDTTGADPVRCLEASEQG